MFKPKNQVDPGEYSRKIKNRGEFEREKARLEYEAQKREALSSPRPVGEDLHLREIGRLKVQVVYQPSFEKSFVWDIREQEENGVKHYELYENELARPDTFAPGYKKVEIDSGDLGQLLNHVYATRLSLAITPARMHALDGTQYGLNVYEDCNRAIKVSWWAEPQEDLTGLDRIIKKYIEQFKEIKEKTILK